MAKTSVVHRNLRRMHQSEMAREKRKSLKLAIKKGKPEEQEAAILKLQKSKRNDSPIRVRRRCQFCGRPHGNLQKFGLCRIHLREAMMRGDVPGLKKASW